MKRLTKSVVDGILSQNDGVEAVTNYNSRNFSETRYYKVEEGKLYYRAKGSTCWSDSKYDDDYTEASSDQARRFIKRYDYKLNLDGYDDDDD